MSDRELLELAAKAAGFQNYTMRGYAVFVETGAARGDSGYYWNPLTDDGDALRLAVRLRIDLHTTPINADAVLVTAKHRMRSDLLRLPNPTQAAEMYQPDPLAATRRAIVRAAAEIGRGVALPVNDDLPEDNYYKSMAEAEETGRTAAEIGRSKE